MEIVKGETWRDKREEILGEERATLLAMKQNNSVLHNNSVLAVEDLAHIQK
jgi:hypothetical protein